MNSFSDDLVAVLEALPSSQEFIGTYRQTILENTAALNNLLPHSDGVSPKDNASAATKACTILFGERAIVLEMSSYAKEQKRNWSPNCWLPAACFLKVQNTVEVALVLKIITRSRTRFAVRSGGHSANPGFGSVDAGILIDLSLVNDIVLSDDHEFVSVGPGAKWDEVYEELEKHELTVAGGRAAGVGVGGLITGGGMSHFSNAWGLACDQVKEFEVVLADSSVVQATESDHADLFRALKGGGANYGIVTRFDLYTKPEYQVWSTLKAYSASDVIQVMDATVEVQENMEKDDKIGLFVSVLKDMFVVGCLYKGWERPLKAFEAFDNIPETSILMSETKGTQKSLARALSIPGNVKRAVGTISVIADSDLYVELHSVLKSLVAPDLSSFSFTFQPFGATAVMRGKAHVGNSLGIAPVSQSWLGIMGEWKDDTNDELAMKQTHQLISSLEAVARTRGLLLDFKFMNDASYTQDPFVADTLSSLKVASRKWDPTGVFQGLQNCGFLVSKVTSG